MSRQRFNKKHKHQNNNQKNSNVINMDHYVTRKKQVVLVPRNLNQETYIEKLLNPSNVIVFGIGPAGTGKTMLAVLAAIKEYKEGTVDRIVVTRPAVGVDDEKHGFLPGDLNSKMEPWTRPIFDVIQEYYSPNEVKKMLEEGVIEISPLAFMRGRTFKKAYIIADEMQNSTMEQMKMLLTRTGTGSFLTVTGDGNQHDRGFEKNGLQDFVNRILGQQIEGISIVQFERKHVERDPIVETVLELYGEE